MTDEPTRCGFVAIIGAPNAGKSTLLNAIVGSKISIVTPKPQTTRSRVLGIRIRGPAQIVFVDTPGIFPPRRRLDRAMVRAAWTGAGDADLVLALVDASDPREEHAAPLLAGLRAADTKAILALNKIDLVDRRVLLALAARMDAEGVFSDVFMISAATGDGLGDLLDHIARALPEGPWLYPEDEISDVPLRQLAAEVTREKLFLQLHEELPYAATVETESWEEFENGDVRIRQIVYVERESQKAIVLGRGGRRIRAIGEAARGELEQLFERKVHLFLFVKVRESWTEDPERFRAIGLDFDA